MVVQPATDRMRCSPNEVDLETGLGGIWRSSLRTLLGTEYADPWIRHAVKKVEGDRVSDGISVQAIDKYTWPDDMADMPKNDILVMPGPFAEPDEFFLRRQRRAFGSDYC